MRITLIHGQNHMGSTYHIGRLLAEQFTDSDIQEFFLPKDLEHFCLGCYKCIENEEECPFYTEKNRIMQAVESADLLIFTTPSYCMHASASMKAFIDLTFTYWMSHRPRECMFSKKAVVISTAAGTGTKSAIKDITNTLFYWGIPYIKEYGIAVQAMNWEQVSPEKKEKNKCRYYKIGQSYPEIKRSCRDENKIYVQYDANDAAYGLGFWQSRKRLLEEKWMAGQAKTLGVNRLQITANP